MKKILVIGASPRINGNSDTLCQYFIKGAKENNNNEIEYIHLHDKNIGYCEGCYSCTKLGCCYKNDDMNELAKKMEEANVIVLATPVYFYSMDGQLKVFIDRMVQNYTKVRADIYIFITAWDSNKDNLVSTLEAIRRFSRDCLEDCPEKGYILASGMENKGDINNSPYLKQAYEMGKNA